MKDLTTVTTPTRLGPDLFRADVPDGWQQGRGAFGGLVLGNLVRAMLAFDAEKERALRTLTAELCGPVLPGPNLIRVERLRTGSAVSTIAARVERDGEVLAHAVAVLGRSRASDTDAIEAPRPALRPWREVAPTDLGDKGPTFARHFEYRALGLPPYSGARDAIASGWIRPLDPGAARDAAYVVSLADAWWPAILAQATTPRPAATVAFTLELIEGVSGLDPAAPLFHTARTLASRGGYLVEMRELWGEDRRLVALNQQTIAIIK